MTKKFVAVVKSATIINVNCVMCQARAESIARTKGGQVPALGQNSRFGGKGEQ